ncbi:MAG TPA: ABC transporter family substrate-binding protein [Acidimicrobiales bacterium]|nr:ABC transporter family substrate-binding protein [Acidimicrobiales bacterium]
MTRRGDRPRWPRWSACLPAALALLAASCGAVAGGTTTAQTLVPVRGGTVTVGIDQAPSACNPNASGEPSWASELVLEAVLPSAFSVDDKGLSAGNLDLVTQAELTSTDPQTVVYTLNPKAVWSDGVPITAEDFRYAWLQQRGTGLLGQPTPQAASSLGYRDIRSVTGSDHGRTVTVVFRQPFADWQSLFHDLLPAHVMEQVGWDPPCTTVTPSIDLSGGPYAISSVIPGREVVLSANPRWWGDPPWLSRIVVRIASSPAQLASWQRRGIVQVVEPSSLSPAVLQSLATDPGTQSELDVSSTYLQLLFSLRSPITAKLAVRQAVAYAVDRQSLVDGVVGWADSAVVPAQSHLYVQTQNGYPPQPASPAPNPFLAAHPATTTTTTSPATSPGSAPGSTPVSWPSGSDPVQSARLMARAGYVPGPFGLWTGSAGQPVGLRMVVDGADAWATATAAPLARQLERAGFAVTVQFAPGLDAAGEALASGSADLALLPYTATPYPSEALADYTLTLGPPGQDGSADWSGFDDPQVDALLARASQILNPVTAQPLYQQVDQILWADMVALPLFAEPTVVAWPSRLAQLSPNPHGASLLWSVVDWQWEVPGPLPGSSSTGSTATRAR